MSDTGEVTKKCRTLVLCFDGTTNEYDNDNTNVVKFFSLLKKDDFNEQLCYYQAGIGTFFSPGVVSPMFQWGAKVLDEAVAWYLDAHVMDGYRFLMQNYRVGDKICLFGFSRGAYTARALAGMLYKVGLLPRDNQEQITFAYNLFKRTDKTGVKLSAGFKQTFCQHVKIEFVGVWDTVSSVGVVMGRTLPFTNSNTAIKKFRHALSLDEHRAKFQPNYYHYPSPDEAGAAKDPEHASPIINLDQTATSRSDEQKLVPKRLSFVRRFSPKRKGRSTSRSSKQACSKDVEGEAETDVLEVWFSGCHSDVGGGAVTDDTVLCLAPVSLRWMVREVMASGCGIQFEEDALIRASISLDFTQGSSTEASTGELDLDEKDALQPIHDELKLNILWWILEIIPLHYSWQDAKGVWHKDYGFHFGKGRVIHDEKPNFHVTVKQRIAAASLKYKPKAKWSAGSEVYVE